jgi:hypothetical protein
LEHPRDVLLPRGTWCPPGRLAIPLFPSANGWVDQRRWCLTGSNLGIDYKALVAIFREAEIQRSRGSAERKNRKNGGESVATELERRRKNAVSDAKDEHARSCEKYPEEGADVGFRIQLERPVLAEQEPD